MDQDLERRPHLAGVDLLPVVGSQAALDVDPRALVEQLAAEFAKFAPGYDAMPFRLVLGVVVIACVPVVGCQREGRQGQAVVEVPDLGVATEVANELDLV